VAPCYSSWSWKNVVWKRNVVYHYQRCNSKKTAWCKYNLYLKMKEEHKKHLHVEFHPQNVWLFRYILPWARKIDSMSSTVYGSRHDVTSVMNVSYSSDNPSSMALMWSYVESGHPTTTKLSTIFLISRRKVAIERSFLGCVGVVCVSWFELLFVFFLFELLFVMHNEFRVYSKLDEKNPSQPFL